MRRHLAFILFVPVLLLSLIGYSSSAQALTPTPTPTGTVDPASLLPTATPLPTLPPTATPGPSLVINPDQVVFGQIFTGDLNLLGPYDRSSFIFSLPQAWKLKPGATLDLSIKVSIYPSTSAVITTDQQAGVAALMQADGAALLNGGTLTVDLNGVALTTIPLLQNGDFEYNVQVPSEALPSIRNDGNMLVDVTLLSDVSCLLYNNQVDVTVRTGSSFTFPHDLVEPDISLANFPKPIIQGSFVPDTAVIVIPDKPSASDLQAAMTISAGLGNLSAQNLITELTTLGKLSLTQKMAGNLIVVGKAASLPVLSELKLAAPMNNGQFNLNPGKPDDGVVEMVVSPWNKYSVVLVVSGNTDLGTIKAAQAISSGSLRQNVIPSLSIVDEVQSAISPVFLPVDQTLAEMGYTIRTFESVGLNTITYRFFVPPGWVVDPEANFNLIFGHSKLINYNRSGLVILLNGQPIGSARFTDQTADIVMNATQIMIPASLIRPGINLISVQATLEPFDNCSPRNMRGMWVNVWPESSLHLPAQQSPIEQSSVNDLADYPEPFIFSPSLNDTAFVLPQNDLVTWNAAMAIASRLGDNANGSISMPTVFYADQVPAAERAKYHLLVLGRPSQLPFITEINELLPAPFETGSESANENTFQVIYRIPENSPSGYVQLLASPWNPDKIIMAVLGKQAEGLNWAFSSLTVPTMRSQLAGNFAVVINDQQIKSTDTRLNPLSAGSIAAPTQAADAAAISVAAPTQVLPVTQQFAWLQPVFGVSVVLLVIIIIVLLFSRNRSRSRK